MKPKVFTFSRMCSGRLLRMFPRPSGDNAVHSTFSPRTCMRSPWFTLCASEDSVSMNDTSISSRSSMHETHCQSSLNMGRWCNFIQRTEFGRGRSCITVGCVMIIVSSRGSELKASVSLPGNGAIRRG